MPRMTTRVDLDHAGRLYETGLSLRKVAAQVGSSPSRLSILLRRHGVTIRTPGTGNYPADLTPTIFELRHQRQTWRQIAETVGMSADGVRARYLASVGWRRGDPRIPTLPPKP